MGTEYAVQAAGDRDRDEIAFLVVGDELGQSFALIEQQDLFEEKPEEEGSVETTGEQDDEKPEE